MKFAWDHGAEREMSVQVGRPTDEDQLVPLRVENVMSSHGGPYAGTLMLDVEEVDYLIHERLKASREIVRHGRTRSIRPRLWTATASR